MMHLVTFSSEDMSRSAEACRRSAIAHGIERAWSYTPNTIADFDQVKANPELFASQRGCGYWAWKPLIISHVLAAAEMGELVIYADAGIEFIDNPRYIVDRMNQDIFLFGNHWEHAHWCKRDIVESVWRLSLDDAKADPATEDDDLTFGEWWKVAGWARFGKQCQASVIFFRVSDYSRKFVREWLDWCIFEGGRLIDDSPSRAANHPEFQENRHDQAILTTLAYREGISLHWWPAIYEGGYVYEKHPQYQTDQYPTLFFHHRRRNHEWSSAA